jgi:hypothetical protein
MHARCTHSSAYMMDPQTVCCCPAPASQDGEATDGPTTADEILPILHKKQRDLDRPVTIHTFGEGGTLLGLCETLVAASWLLLNNLEAP